jgi:steroid 5-alpha reductase family enzyme
MSALADVAPGLLTNLAMTAALVALCQLALWGLSVRLRDASIVDIFWGPGFAVVAVATWMHQQGVGVESRKAVLVGLATLWAVRLGCHVYWRARGHGEDPRYASFRKKATGNEHLFMLRHVFYKQGVSMWITSLPLQVGQFWLKPEGLGPVAWIGIAVWCVGFIFETVGDWQLARFKADPANRGKIMQTGLWRYTRHPNYFGDACVWWGIFLVACDHWLGVLTVFAPLRMTNSLVNRTGKKLLEKKMRRERPEYEAYVQKTSGFFPWKPRA